MDGISLDDEANARRELDFLCPAAPVEKASAEVSRPRLSEEHPVNGTAPNGARSYRLHLLLIGHRFEGKQAI